MGSPTPTVYCPANKKTEVLWAVADIKQYIGRFSVPRETISWERNCDLPPWHTWGTWDTSQPFSAWVTGAYTNFWFTSPVGLSVTFTPV